MSFGNDFGTRFWIDFEIDSGVVWSSLAIKRLMWFAALFLEYRRNTRRIGAAKEPSKQGGGEG